MTKNRSKNGSTPQLPDKEQDSTRIPLIVFLFFVFAGVVLLVYGLYGLYTGELLTIGKITFMYGKFLAARTDGYIIPALLLICAALLFFIYGVYGLRRGWMRDITPSRGGYRLSAAIRYRGLPMWVMFLAYLSLSLFLIKAALVLVYNNTPPFPSRDSGKLMDEDYVPLFLSVALLFVAGWLDSAIGGRNMQDVLANLRERFGRDSEGKKALLEKGIAYDRKTFFEFIEEDDIATVKLFLDAGMDINGVDPLNLYTPLSYAAKNGHLDLVKLFVDRKADVNKHSPVWEAVSDFDNTAILRLLIKNSADIGVTNNDGKTIFMEAAEALSIDSVKFLLEHKADINAKTDDGHTALVYAVERTEAIKGNESSDRVKDMNQDSYDMAKYLLEQGADPNVKISGLESKNDTPLKIARSRKVKEMVQLLESNQARE